jgi:hypothetical protein
MPVRKRRSKRGQINSMTSMFWSSSRRFARRHPRTRRQVIRRRRGREVFEAFRDEIEAEHGADKWAHRVLDRGMGASWLDLLGVRLPG